MRVLTVLLCCAVVMWTAVPAYSAGESATDDNSLINSLADDLRNRKTVPEAIDAIAASDAERRGEWLEQILEGKLYVRKSDNKVVSVEKSDAGFTLTSASDGSPLGEAGKRDVSKIKINNKLRGKLRSALAQLALSHPDPAKRLAAVERMMSSLDDAKANTINELAASEPDPDVKSLMLLAGSINALENGSKDQQLEAIDTLGINTRSIVSQRLAVLAESEDTEVAAAASASLEKIRSRISIFEKVETVLFGLSLGSVLAMAAIGLAITFGVMG